MLKKKSIALQSGQFLALVASLLILGQIGYIHFKGASFCLNEGCKIVEQLTRVSPLVFNLTGLLFFQIIFWGIWAARAEQRRLPRWIGVLLLTALGVEAVLVSFQYLVVHGFCAYCLGILGIVILLNLLLGPRQILAGLVLFSSVALAFSSLDLQQVPLHSQAFRAGVMAGRPGHEEQVRHHLFFSSTCTHCEKVIASLKTNPRPTVFFNPIDRVRSLDLDGTRPEKRYSPRANRALLSALGIQQIPVLISLSGSQMTILQGESAILAALNAGPPAAQAQSGVSALPVTQSSIPGLNTQDGCEVSSDCTPPRQATPQPATGR